MRDIERALLIAELLDNIVLAQSRTPRVWRPAEAKAYAAARRLVRMADRDAWVQRLAETRATVAATQTAQVIRSRSRYTPGTWTGD